MLNIHFIIKDAGILKHTVMDVWEDSIDLAIDTGILDIITGDLNNNMLNVQLAGRDLCEQCSLTQAIQEPTHFTEHFSSLLGIILIAMKTI